MSLENNLCLFMTGPVSVRVSFTPFITPGLVAQAVSEILPDDDKEKQLMQRLLNQRDRLEEAGRQRKLF
jgi:hypothetical protein